MKKDNRQILITSVILIFSVILFAQLLKNILTKENKQIPDNPKNMLAIVYSKNCPDCRAVFKDIIKYHYDDNVYLIDITDIKKKTDKYSTKIKAFLEKFPVGEIPSAVYIHKDGIHHTVKKLYIKSNERIIFDETNMENMIKLKKDER